MMVPDSAMIAEIMLFSEGFPNTKVFSKKVDTLYRLANQQLTRQHHYDFGLRALTSALKVAGVKKRGDFESADDNVLFTAMRDCNVPKLSSEDVPIFLAILRDLFPAAEISQVDNSELKAAISEEMALLNMQHIPAMVSKVIQLYETKASRHGVMIVGDTGSGKSTVWKLLQSTMLKMSKVSPDRFVAAKVSPLNPKSYSPEEMYGAFSTSINDWSDGILSNLLRTACSDEKKDQKWILLDGPVDTLWIESMNTVLDDNKVLTLINGERIALTENVSLLFEVDNLSMASPSTVSRVGIIYMDYTDLGWRPFVESWIQCRNDQHAADHLRRLSEKILAPIFEFRKSCLDSVPVSESSAVRSFCTLYDSVATAGMD